jgi:lipoprotein-anchoring transpeptidase ErfK/SrfK
VIVALPFARVRPPPFLVAMAMALAVAVGASAGCTGERPSLAAPVEASDLPPVEAGKVATPDARGVDVAVVATAMVPDVGVYATPDAVEPNQTFTNPRPEGGPLVLLVDRSIGEWHQVLLPEGPAGSAGWVRSADVTVTRHNFRIEVHLSEYRLDVFLQGQLVRQLKIGIGGPAAPAPGGRYFTTELVQPRTPDPVLGSLAYRLSGGDFALHGTDDPAGIGRHAAEGSIFMRDDEIEELATFLPLGVPVGVYD